jgi:hypothetical protein
MGRKRQGFAAIHTEIAQEVPLPLEWGGYIIRPTDEKFDSIYDLPNDGGVYAWYSREGDLLYVGRSIEMNSRLRRHHMPLWGGVLLSYRIVPDRYLAGVERAHIDALCPYHNVSRESANLPFWGSFCQAIRAAWEDVLPAMKERVRTREHEIAEQIAGRL